MKDCTRCGNNARFVPEGDTICVICRAELSRERERREQAV